MVFVAIGGDDECVTRVRIERNDGEAHREPLIKPHVERVAAQCGWMRDGRRRS